MQICTSWETINTKVIQTNCKHAKKFTIVLLKRNINVARTNIAERVQCNSRDNFKKLRNFAFTPLALRLKDSAENQNKPKENLKSEKSFEEL